MRRAVSVGSALLMRACRCASSPAGGGELDAAELLAFQAEALGRRGRPDGRGGSAGVRAQPDFRSRQTACLRDREVSSSRDALPAAACGNDTSPEISRPSRRRVPADRVRPGADGDAVQRLPRVEHTDAQAAVVGLASALGRAPARREQAVASSGGSDAVARVPAAAASSTPARAWAEKQENAIAAPAPLRLAYGGQESAASRRRGERAAIARAVSAGIHLDAAGQGVGRSL